MFCIELFLGTEKPREKSDRLSFESVVDARHRAVSSDAHRTTPTREAFKPSNCDALCVYLTRFRFVKQLPAGAHLTCDRLCVKLTKPPSAI